MATKKITLNELRSIVKQIIKEEISNDGGKILTKPKNNDKNDLINIINSNLKNIKFTNISNLDFKAEKAQFVKHIENVGDLYQDMVTKKFIFKTIENYTYVLS
jgi:hypothetical protein